MAINVLPTKQIQNFTMKVFSPENECIGIIHNELQLYYVQAQIAQAGVNGYYIMYKKVRYDIQEDGRIRNDDMMKFDNPIESMLCAICGF